MATLFDLDTVTLRLVQQSFVSQAHGYALLDEHEQTVGWVTQRIGSALGVLRRHLSSNELADPLDFDVTDVSGALQLTVAKRKTGMLAATIQADAVLADGQVVARAKARWGARPDFTVTDEAEERVYATVARGGAVLFAITGPDGVPLGEVDLEPDTLSTRTAGTSRHGYTLRFGADTPLLVRMATLAAVVSYDSVRVS